MWIWISVCVWVLGWLCFNRVARNVWKNQERGWDCTDMVISATLGLVWPIGLGIFLATDGKDCFKRRNKMKIYYDAKDEQIKDKNGVCRYDQSAILELIGGADERINAHFKLCEEREANLKAQLQCGAKGHGKWEFVKKDTATGVLTIGCGEAQFLFFFKCKSCGLEITKRKKELTAKEKEGLAKLGLL